MLGKNAGMRAAGLAACVLAALAINAGPAAASMELNGMGFDLSSYQSGGHPEADLLASVTTGSEEVLKSVTWIAGAGWVLEPESAANCTSFSACQPDSQIGVVTVKGEHEGNAEFLLGTAPVYQMTPSSGQYLRLGFRVPTVNLPVAGEATLPVEPHIVGLNETDPYQMGLVFDQLPQSTPLTSIKMTLWAVPAAAAHDAERFPAGSAGCPGIETTSCLTEPHPSSAPAAALTLNDVYCEPGETTFINWTPWVVIHAYQVSKDEKTEIGTKATDCTKVGFTPTLTAAPTTTAGYTRAGLVFDVTDPQSMTPGGVSQSELRSAVMTTRGLVLDPALSEHPLCEDSAAAIVNDRPSACPEASKIGNVEFEYAGLSEPILGEIFLGKAVGGKDRVFVVGVGGGLELKLLGTIEQPEPGRLKFTFGAQPRLPIAEEKFEFEPGFVRTPVHCGTYVVEGSLAPWEPNHSTATPRPKYTIASGPNDSSCIGAPASVSLKLDPATITAGGSSQTTATIAVRDAEGNGVPAEEVQLSSSDPQQKIGPVVDNEDGTYSAVITGSANIGPTTITATDASSNPKLTGSATLTQTAPSEAAPVIPPPAPLPPAPPLQTPHVRLVKKPPKRGTNRRPRIEFSADVAGVTFACRLDRGPFKHCTSPFTLPRLSLGSHTFSVRAANGAVVGPAATWTFKVTRSTRHHKHRRRGRHRR